MHAIISINYLPRIDSNWKNLEEQDEKGNARLMVESVRRKEAPIYQQDNFNLTSWPNKLQGKLARIADNT